MPDRAHLRRASDHATTAGDRASGEAAERLRDLGDQLDQLAERDRGPDHGRLARIQTAFNEVEPDLPDDASRALDDARDAVTEYRKGVEGV